jgi:hypothetical protein
MLSSLQILQYKVELPPPYTGTKPEIPRYYTRHETHFQRPRKLYSRKMLKTSLCTNNNGQIKLGTGTSCTENYILRRHIAPTTIWSPDLDKSPSKE